MSFLAGVQSGPSSVVGATDRPSGVFTPLNYGMVTDSVHRSALPEPRHFGFLQLIGIRSIIVLSPGPPAPELNRWATENGVLVLHPQSVWVGKSTALSESAAAEVVAQLISGALPSPVLVACPSGRYRTGVVVGCLRKVDRWNTAAIVDEYRRFAEGRARVENEEFVEMFDVSLVVSTPATKAESGPTFAAAADAASQ